jgi:hypothetical protein
MALIDILDQQTARDAREYSQDFDGSAGLPSVVQQVGDVEKKRKFQRINLPSVQELANYEASARMYEGDPVETYQRPDNLKKSDRDERWVGYQDALHTEARRAEQQSGAEQLANGILKGVVIAGTTFLDGIVGTAAGIANLAYQAANGDIERPADALYAFIDNPVSRSLQKVNEAAEKVMPNYYSDEQRENPWYAPVNLFSANFIGDKFLKNTGFMLGAAYSGRVNAGAMSKVMAKKELRDAFKGVVVNSANKELKTASEIYKAYKTGDAFIDGVKLTKDLANQAKQIRNQEWGMKVLGSLTSAAGEARIEAITNTDDYVKRMQAKIDDDYRDATSRIRNEVIARNTTGNPTYRVFWNPETRRNDIEYTEEGQRIADELMANINERYQQAQIQLQQDRAVMANQIFGLNMAILSGSNMYTFGRFIAGGYKTANKASGLVKGTIRKGFNESKEARNKAIAKAISVPFVEGPYEEMMQSAASLGAGYNASAKMNRFYGYKIDEDAQDDAVNVVNAILQGIHDTYTDANKWEEGTIGALSSMLGIPGFVETRNDEGIVQYEEYKDKNGNTKYKPKKNFRLQGEFIESIRDAKDANRKSKTLTEELNKIVQNPEFISQWQSYIRHRALDNLKQEALDSGNMFFFKNSDNDQLISDIMAFDKAGRIQDLYNLIDEGINVTENDVQQLTELARDKETGISPYDGMRAEDVVKTVKEHSEDFKKKFEKYLSIKDDIKQVYGTQMDDKFLEALTWGYMTVYDAEERIKNLSDELVPKLNDIFHVFSALSGQPLGIDVSNIKDLFRFTLNEKERKKFLDVINRKSARYMGQDKVLPLIEQILKEKDEILDELEATNEFGTEEEKKKIKAIHETSLNSYLSALRILDLVSNDPTLHPISDMEMSKIHTDMMDLGNLLAYRSDFLDMLATLTTDPGSFDKSVTALNTMMTEKNNRDQAQKLYDSIPEDMDQKAFNDLMLNKVRNPQQYDMLSDMLKKSPNQSLKNLYKNFDELVNAIETLNKVSSVSPDDPLAGLKHKFINDLSERISEDSPASKDDLINYIDQEAEALGFDEARDFADELVNAITVNQERKDDADEIIKPAEKKEKPKEPPKPVTPEAKKEEPTTHRLFDDEGYPIDENGTRISEEKTPKEEATSGGKVDDNENYRVVEDAIKKMSVEELESIVLDNKIPASINGKIPIKHLKKLAQFYLDEDKADNLARGTIIVDKEKDKSEDAKAEPQRKTDKGDKVFEYPDGTVLNGAGITKYNIGDLNDRNVVNLYDNPVAKTLDEEFNAYGFLGSGALAKIEKYNISRGERTLINFIFANKNEGTRYSKTLYTLQNEGQPNQRDNYNILTAIEITDELRSKLTKEQQDQVKTVDIGGKQYQILGAMRQLTGSEDSKNAYDKIYTSCIESIDRQRENSETMGQDLFVGDYNGIPVQSIIAKIYTGRLPKVVNGNQYTSFKKLIDTPIQKAIRYGVAVRSKKTGVIEIFTDDPNQPVKRPEQLGIPAVAGMVYAFIQAPDGSLTYVPIVMSRSDEIQWNAENPSSFVKAIRAEVDILLDPTKSYDEKLDAKLNIMGSFAQRVQFYFRMDEPNAFVFAGKKIKSWEDFVSVLSDERTSLRVHFDKYAPRDPETVKDLIDSDLMHARYQSLQHLNPSFLIFSLDAKTAQPRKIQPKTIGAVQHSPLKEEEAAVIQFGNQQYHLNDEGKFIDEDGELVDEELARRLLLQFSVIKTDDTQDFGMDIERQKCSTAILYIVDGAPDGSFGRFYMTRHPKSKVLREITKQEAEELSEYIVRQQKVEIAKDAEKKAKEIGADVIHGPNDSALPETPSELTKKDVTPQPISPVQPVEEKATTATETGKKKKKRGPAKNVGGIDISIGSRDITDEDIALIPTVTKYGADRIQSWLEARGVKVQYNLTDLNDAVVAQYLRNVFEENKNNPVISKDQMETDLNCGKHSS